MSSDDDFPPAKKQKIKVSDHQLTAALNSVNRKMLDFDFEKLCSISLSNLNVYCCLVCGKYLQGRGPNSNAFFHSMSEDHHIFINLNNQNVWVLPENHQIHDQSLGDIKYVINPTFDQKMVEKMNASVLECTDLNGKIYKPGYIGLNNLKASDYMNVLVLAFSHIRIIRDFCLLEPLSRYSELVQRLGLLIKKIWNPRAFKDHVSPHEFAQEVASRSNKRFTFEQRMDPIDLMAFLLNTIHVDTGGTKTKSSIIHDSFRGILNVESQAVISISSESVETGFAAKKVPFLFLALDLPPNPLYTSEDDRTFIPQVQFKELLSKYDGSKTFTIKKTLVRYSIAKLPRYLIFTIKRFSKNSFVEEKNPTIVNFPTQNLDMAPYLTKDSRETKTKYDLLANIAFDGSAKLELGKFKLQILQEPTNTWLEIQDLFVDKILSQTIHLAESYIQIWKQQI